MPLFRKSVNKASLNYFKARKANKSEYNIDGHGLANIDFKQAKKELEAKEKLKRLVEQRKKGVKSFARVLASPATKRLIKLKKFRQMQEAKKTNQSPKNNFIKRNLGDIHPLFKGIFSHEPVAITSKSGAIRKGKIVDAMPGTILFEMDGKVVSLRMERIVKVKTLK
jgi:hypothetical protein